MKKFFSMFCVALLLFTSTITLGTNHKVFAEAAPALSDFRILGYADDGVLAKYGRKNCPYTYRYEAPYKPVHGQSVYIVTRQIGYGSKVVFYVDGNYYQSPNIVGGGNLSDNNGNICGFEEMDELDFIKPGTHTIKAFCTSLNPVYQGTNFIYPSFDDSITLTVEAN